MPMIGYLLFNFTCLRTTTMKQFKRILVFRVLIVFFMCLPHIVSAQAGDPGCDPDNMKCGDPDCTFRVWCPIDKGLILLLGAGVLYGIKEVKDQRKKAPIKEF